jgi:hypothetical protein
MKTISSQKSFLPQHDGYALDFIKLCAAIFMVIDHINGICLHDSQILMEFIGRGTFPLFCYAVAMAVFKNNTAPFPREGGGPESVKNWVPAFAGTRNGRYLLRLFIFALVSQPFYFFAWHDATVNVIFTLALGLVFAILSFRAKAWQMYTLYALALASMLWTLPLEFGLAGVMLPSAILLVLRGQKGIWPFLILLLMFMNAGGILEGLRQHAGLLVWVSIVFNGLFSIFLPWGVLDMAGRLPQTGRFLSKYALYVFYPAHLVILKLLAPFI